MLKQNTTTNKQTTNKQRERERERFIWVKYVTALHVFTSNVSMVS